MKALIKKTNKYVRPIALMLALYAVTGGLEVAGTTTLPANKNGIEMDPNDNLSPNFSKYCYIKEKQTKDDGRSVERIVYFYMTDNLESSGKRKLKRLTLHQYQSLIGDDPSEPRKNAADGEAPANTERYFLVKSTGICDKNNYQVTGGNMNDITAQLKNVGALLSAQQQQVLSLDHSSENIIKLQADLKQSVANMQAYLKSLNAIDAKIKDEIKGANTQIKTFQSHLTKVNSMIHGDNKAGSKDFKKSCTDKKGFIKNEKMKGTGTTTYQNKCMCGVNEATTQQLSDKNVMCSNKQWVNSTPVATP
jgi:hypothetical protein